MNREELIKNQFPNDEFLQAAVLRIVDKCVAELELKIKHITKHLEPQVMTTLFEQVEEEVEVEQGIKKLEDENKELKREKIPQLERKIASIRGAHSVDCKKLNARIEQVKQLKEENAELKNKLEHRNCVDCSNHGSNIKLTKAKELLKRYVKIYVNPYPEEEIELREEAERFLEEVSE